MLQVLGMIASGLPLANRIQLFLFSSPVPRPTLSTDAWGPSHGAAATAGLGVQMTLVTMAGDPKDPAFHPSLSTRSHS
jgi:hypothetical protein